MAIRTISSARRGARLFIDNRKCKLASRENPGHRVSGDARRENRRGFTPLYVNQRALRTAALCGFLEQFRARRFSQFSVPPITEPPIKTLELKEREVEFYRQL